MTRRLIVRPEAHLDLEEAAFWYETQRSGLAIRFLGEVGALLDRIASGPFQFPDIGQGVRRGLLRRFP